MTTKVKKPLTTRNGGFGGANQPLSAKNASDRWNNSKMTATTTGENQKPAKQTIEMYETALSGPPSKEWQEKKRKEESRKAAEAARARGEAARRGSR